MFSLPFPYIRVSFVFSVVFEKVFKQLNAVFLSVIYALGLYLNASKTFLTFFVQKELCRIIFRMKTQKKQRKRCTYSYTRANFRITNNHKRSETEKIRER